MATSSERQLESSKNMKSSRKTELTAKNNGLVEHHESKSKKGLKEDKVKQKIEIKNKKEHKGKTKDKGESKIKKTGNKYKHDEVILSLTIHRLDRTEGLPVLLSHPVVEVFISNCDEGTLLKKSYRRRKVTSFYEDDKVTEILPLMTQPFDVQERKSLFCQWEEELIFNESLNYMRENECEIIFFFHLKDFGTSKSTLKNSTSLIHSGWKTFAWAFLKLCSSTGQENIGERIRLQLYRPRKLLGVKFNDIFSWWKSGSRRKYNSSLHITAQGRTLPQNSVPSHRSMLPNQKEVGKSTGFGSQHELHSKRDSKDESDVKEIVAMQWDRNHNEPCQIPNTIAFQLSTLGQGCMTVKFSNNGLRLACGTQQSILVYDIISGNLDYYLRGHLGLVYSLEWNSGNNYLLSCSADATVRVWELRVNSEYLMKVLIHPSYVYTTKFGPGDHSIIISGCYDHIIRVWSLQDDKYNIIQELNDHLGYVSSLAFDPDNKHLYSADKQGILVKWKVNIFKRKKGNSLCLELSETIKLEDVHGIPINHIICHPHGHRILIHSRDSCIRLVNLRTQNTTQKLQGILNTRELIKCCLSPCGNWVLSGSEDSSLAVWDSETGELCSALFDLPFTTTISCVDFHPYANMIAVGSCADQTTILLMKYDEKKASANNIPMTVLPTLSEDSISKPLTGNVKSSVEKSSLFHEENAESEDRWKNVGKKLLKKLDFILKAANEDSSQLLEISKHENKSYQALALHSYSSTAADEASLKKGEHVKVIKEMSADWWIIERTSGQRGSVPSSYLQPVPSGMRRSRGQSKTKVGRGKEKVASEVAMIRRNSSNEPTKPSFKASKFQKQRSRSQDSSTEEPKFGQQSRKS